MSTEKSGTASLRGSVDLAEPTPAQRAFARGVAESKATIPHVYFEAALKSRPGLAALTAACGRALREVPMLNGAYRDGRFERYGRVNVAVGVDAGDTIFFPVVRDADRVDESGIEAKIAEFAAGARDGSLPSPAYAGATFTIIDMSEHAERFAPVINHGQAATLGLGSAALILACDNRIVQAGEGGDLLKRITGLLAA